MDCSFPALKLVQGDSANNFTAPQQPPSPPHRDHPLPLNENSPMMTFYDIGSCPVPPSTSCLKLRNNIDSLLPKLVGFAGVLDMTAYHKPDFFEKKINQRRDLVKGRITVVSTEPPLEGKQKRPDQLIKQLMHKFVLENPEIPVLLISNDVRFASCLRELTASKYTVILAHDKNAEKELTGAVEKTIDWELLAKGEQGKPYQNYLIEEDEKYFQATGKRGPLYKAREQEKMAKEEIHKKKLIDMDKKYFDATGKQGTRYKEWEEKKRKREERESPNKKRKKGKKGKKHVEEEDEGFGGESND
ncbi:PREDICTED: uncharacterized protein LOC104715540 [Camelina sativa]|uniref:Uncharacterized protein LOC104715540 n=1 Tax=Camelina sativa TaxID=90675 RepID=A0ABM0TTP7_CAMSA|nr:PREDICTED: uncharacterized protein LOC104715540 [Camelina sativa]